MLVEINLLSQPKRRNVSIMILLLTIILALVLSIIAGAIWYKGELSKVEGLEDQLAHIQELKRVQEMDNSQSINTPTKQYESAIQWVSEYPVSTVTLLNGINELLPERGYIINFEYSQPKEVYLVTQFDSSREVAFFYERIKESALFSVVTLYQITTDQVEANSDIVLPRYRADFNLTIEPSAVKGGD